ncbi:uncharacterized protein [Littorina saxatilis]|uniref:Uncharacterized protein n=1 Tax=Littorina saxatilis TaxID=31220 RepID=A0AAN9B297_9CAEN|eukprot:GHVL01024689.1.p1 GENE.GHVL01024689.1~~GHVL01024689.1.p1  ORF type:complete len:201 (+),score=10.67 GHVL01024689.1:155-757(+)
MKVLLVAMVIFVAKANAWFFRNSETTATADGRGIDDGCEAFGEAGSCEFFDCFEQRLPCGRDFYMQRYGNNYCNRFNTFMESFTEAGQEFLVNSQQCVTRRLLEYYRRDYINCHDLEHDAIAMIGPCYMESGFCDIIGDNTEQFIEVFEFNDLFGSGSAKLWRELLGLARQCGGRSLANFMSTTASRLSPLRSFFGGDKK